MSGIFANSTMPGIFGNSTMPDGYSLSALQSCDTSSNILLAVLCVAGLIVSMFGYRLYTKLLGILAFLLAFGAAGIYGATWIAVDPNPDTDLVKMVIVVVCCTLWGTLAAVICIKFEKMIHRLLGFALGASFGFMAVGISLYFFSDIISENIGAGFRGWDGFALIIVGVPVALLTGFITRKRIKHFLMAAFAILGAAVAVRSVAVMLLCADAGTEIISRQYVQALAVLFIALLGVGVQMATQPKESLRNLKPVLPADGHV